MCFIFVQNSKFLMCVKFNFASASMHPPTMTKLLLLLVELIVHFYNEQQMQNLVPANNYFQKEVERKEERERAYAH